MNNENSKKVIGEYVLLEYLGGGQQGDVYMGKKLNNKNNVVCFEEKVAIKMIKIPDK